MYSNILTSLALLVATPSASPQPELANALRSEIEAMRRSYDVSGLAVSVVEGDHVILSEGFGRFEDGPATEDSRCGLFSATKALSAFTLASLVEDGAIDLDAPLGELLEESPDVNKLEGSRGAAVLLFVDLLLSDAVEETNEDLPNALSEHHAVA